MIFHRKKHIVWQCGMVLIPMLCITGCGRESTVPPLPNIVLVMADDLGWGDVGFNGNTIIRTPNLDRMAGEGLVFERFYAASAVCSPTRGSCLTGRHPFRYGVYTANAGHLPVEEITLPELLKTKGYVTGHFGKWHLGTLTTTEKDSNRGGPGGAEHFSPPNLHGYDHSFVTEAKVPTYDPMTRPPDANPFCWGPLQAGDSALPYGTAYWNHDLSRAHQNLEGDDSRIIMDRAASFMENSMDQGNPFLAVIWFHAPHLPVVASERHLRMYEEHGLYTASYYGCITALDEQMGRMYQLLEGRGAINNTMIWFCSDNGPEGQAGDSYDLEQEQRPVQVSGPGTAAPFRGRKRDLYEGGVRVPAFLFWPGKIASTRTSAFPAVTSDYLPTILDVLEIGYPDARPIDGMSLRGLIDGEELTTREKPIFFHFGDRMALHDNALKLITYDDGKSWQMYNVEEDPSESVDIIADLPDQAVRYKSLLYRWVESCEASDAGADY
jgi:arylsulfatase A-like enzyme